jgi:EAL domain-containing protein (putative c-di-GMP-specific phosphodiesterase class I)
MDTLIHLIYSSAAAHDFSTNDLTALLEKSKINNNGLGVTGMLLYTDNSFFQILEGERDTVQQLFFDKISKDMRHTKVVMIVNEAIAKRSFGDWSMGYASISPEEVGQIVGLNDFFTGSSCFGQIDSGRAKKLLAAFKEGRWRTKIKDSTIQEQTVAPKKLPARAENPKVSFAYQPIVDMDTRKVAAFEALVHGVQDEAADDSPAALSHFDSNCRVIAIGIACQLNLACNLHLNFCVRDVRDTKAAIRDTLEAAARNHLDASRIVLEIDPDHLNGNTLSFAKIIQEFRSAGIKILLDHFGTGRSGLDLLEPVKPDFLALSQNCVRDVDSNGVRQAIVRGIVQTCADLGIDIIAKNVDRKDEYLWLRDEGIHLFQGALFASPAYEQLATAVYPDA